MKTIKEATDIAVINGSISKAFNIARPDLHLELGYNNMNESVEVYMRGEKKGEINVGADSVYAALLETINGVLDIIAGKKKEVSVEKDMVEIHCYGSKRIMERSVAIEEFTVSACCCEGSEQSRYMSIVSDLRCGKKIASDGDPILH